MTSNAPKDASRSHKIRNRIVRSLDIVERAIAQADALFPTSRLTSLSDPTYSDFRQDSFWKIDSVIKEYDPTISVERTNQIIVETELAVGVLVAVRGLKNNSPRHQFLKAEAFVKELLDSLRHSAEIITRISKDEFLSFTVARALRKLASEDELAVRNAILKRLHDSAGDPDESGQTVFERLREEMAKEMSPILNMLFTLYKFSVFLEPLANKLSDSRPIRNAVEYRCASALAWIWWEHLGRYPTLTRNDGGRAPEDVPKTAFQSFVEVAVPHPVINVGILRKAVEDLRLITSAGITEKDARGLLATARTVPEPEEFRMQSARSILVFLRGQRGEPR